jgi:hypothetical protein
MLYEIQSNDLISLFGASTLLAATALVVNLRLTRKASRIRLIIVLREP